jgi:hypothetical protein
VRRRHEEDLGTVEVAERLLPYDVSAVPELRVPERAEGELVERAATLLTVMPPNQERTTIEQLLAPHDPDRGRRAVDALIATGFAAEDGRGHLRRSA